MTDDATRCALEYDCVRRGRHDPRLRPVSAFTSGARGLLQAVRIYDDTGIPAT